MSRPWSEEERETLKAAWGTTPLSVIVRRLGRSGPSCRRVARALGLPSKTRRPKRPAHVWHLRWTPDDLRVLTTRWGEIAVRELARELGRSEDAVSNKAKRLGLPPASQGRVSLEQLVRETGWALRRIRTAMTLLGMTIEKAPTTYPRAAGVLRPRKMLREEQAEELIAFLKAQPDGLPLSAKGSPQHGREVWGVDGRPAACLGHGDTDRAHRAKGLCEACYQSRWIVEKRRRLASSSVGP